MKRYAGRSPIPGHLRIEVLAADGSMLEEGVVRYYRRNAKSGIAYFSREFDVRPKDVRTVRVIHRLREEILELEDGSSHNTELKVSSSAVCCPSSARS